jgi:Flp pilus assembly pilin Flp
MRTLAKQFWNDEDGVLSFEWVLLVTLLVIGIVSGVTAARDAIVDELGDVAQTMLVIDQSYTITFPLAVNVHTAAPTTSSASDTAFTDALIYLDCSRPLTQPFSQTSTSPGSLDDIDS